MALSVGFRVSVSLHPATQATGPRLLPRWDYLPLSVPAFPGRTGLLSVHSRYGLQTRRVAYATLYTRGLDGFVTSTAAPVATGWSDPVPGRVFLPLWTNAFSRRTVTSPLHSLSLRAGVLSEIAGFRNNLVLASRTANAVRELVVLEEPQLAQRLEGIVVDSSGSPIPDMTVTDRTENGVAVLRTTQTDNAGHFHFPTQRGKIVYCLEEHVYRA